MIGIIIHHILEINIAKQQIQRKSPHTTTIDEYQLRLVYAAQIMIFQMNSSSSTNSSNPFLMLIMSFTVKRPITHMTSF